MIHEEDEQQERLLAMQDDEDRRYDEMVDRHLEGNCRPNCPECRRRRITKETHARINKENDIDTTG